MENVLFPYQAKISNVKIGGKFLVNSIILRGKNHDDSIERFKESACYAETACKLPTFSSNEITYDSCDTIDKTSIYWLYGYDYKSQKAVGNNNIHLYNTNSKNLYDMERLPV